MVMFLLSFVKGSKSAEGGLNPLKSASGYGPRGSKSASGYGPGGPYPLAYLDRGSNSRGGPNPLGHRHKLWFLGNQARVKGYFLR